MQNKVLTNKVYISIITASLVITSALLWNYYYGNKTNLATQSAKHGVGVSFKKPGLPTDNLNDVFVTESSLTTAVKTNSQKLNLEQPLTDEMARSLLLAYLTRSQTNPNDPAQNTDKLIQEISEDFLNVKYTTYTKEDLNYSNLPIQASEYTKKMRRALSPLYKIKEYELDTVAKAIKDADKNAFNTLNEDIELYTQTIGNLLKIPVDENLLVPHLALINAYSKLVASLELISGAKNDIMLAYPGLKLFLEADNEIYEAYDALKMYVELKDKKQNNHSEQ